MIPVTIQVGFVDDAWKGCDENVTRSWTRRRKYKCVFSSQTFVKRYLPPRATIEQYKILKHIPINLQNLIAVTFYFKKKTDAMAFKLRWL